MCQIDLSMRRRSLKVLSQCIVEGWFSTAGDEGGGLDQVWIYNRFRKVETNYYMCH